MVSWDLIKKELGSFQALAFYPLAQLCHLINPMFEVEKENLF